MTDLEFHLSPECSCLSLSPAKELQGACNTVDSYLFALDRCAGGENPVVLVY